jgi:hypothetical protein
LCHRDCPIAGWLQCHPVAEVRTIGGSAPARLPDDAGDLKVRPDEDVMPPVGLDLVDGRVRSDRSGLEKAAHEA